MSVEFIPTTHQYLVNGVITPSVSQLLRDTLFADKYSDVPEFVLKKAAAFGTAVHHAIEHDDDSLLDDTQKRVFADYKHLIDKHGITPTKHEQIVYTGDYAGTFDMLAQIDGEEVLVDIKTTYNLDIDYLSWQLSLYAYAYGHQGKLYAIWLPKRKKGKVVEIPRVEEFEIIELLEAYNALQKVTDEQDIQW